MNDVKRTMKAVRRKYEENVRHKSRAAEAHSKKEQDEQHASSGLLLSCTWLYGLRR